MPLDGKRQPQVYAHSEFNETHGQFSPDGHWIAYVSDESGRPEIVRPAVPAYSGQRQVARFK